MVYSRNIFTANLKEINCYTRETILSQRFNATFYFDKKLSLTGQNKLIKPLKLSLTGQNKLIKPL